MNKMQKKFRILSFFIALLLLFSGCKAVTPPNKTENPTDGLAHPQSRAYYTNLKGNNEDTFTIMIYMNGGLSESEYGMASAAIDRMLSATLNKNVTVLLEVGGTDVWQNDYFTAEKSERLRIDENGLHRAETEVKNDMADREKLESFILSSKKNNPASRYGFIFWGELPFDMLTLSQVFAGQKFDFIGFDTPGLTEIEFLYALEPCADYVIAHTDAYTATPWDYEAVFNKIAEKTSLATASIAKTIAQTGAENEYYAISGTAYPLYCADLTKIKYAVDGVDQLRTALLGKLEKGEFPSVAQIRGVYGTNDYVSVTNLAAGYDMPACREGIDTMLAYPEADDAASIDLCTYFPTGNEAQIQQSLASFSALGLAYEPFVSAYMSIALGAALYEQTPPIDTDTSALPTDDSAPTAENTSSPAPSTTPGATFTGELPAYPWIDREIIDAYEAKWYASFVSSFVAPTYTWEEEMLHVPFSAETLPDITAVTLTCYLHNDTENLFLQTMPLEKSATEGFSLPFSEERLAINGQTVSLSSYAGTHESFFRVPAYINQEPVDLLFLESATLEQSKLLGVLKKTGIYTTVEQLKIGDLLQFRYQFFDDVDAVYKEAAYGVIIPLASEELTLTIAPISSGTLYVKIVTHDIYGVEHASELGEFQALLLEEDASPAPTETDA